MTETLQSFKNQLETFRASTLRHHTGWKGEELPKVYWERLKEDLERTEAEWDALLAEGSKRSREARDKARVKAAIKGILLA